MGDLVIHLEGYVWFGQNRMTHIKAPRGSGGVGIFVKSFLFREYEIEIVDKTVDGIIGICFTHRYSDYGFAVLLMLFTPETSFWGRDASTFFAHLSSQMYLFSNLDAIYVVGDFNSRIGDKMDYVKEVDNIPMRIAIDDYVNRHGKAFLEFLVDAKRCVLNSRVSPLSDNFTSISTKGKAVVYSYTL